MSLPTLRFAAFLLLAALGRTLLPRELRKPWLLLACGVFYWLAGGGFVLLLAAETVVSWALALAAQKRLWGKRRLWTGLGAFSVLGLLFLLKYARFFLSLGGLEGFLPAWALPAGISFFSFSISGYLFDVGKGKYPAEPSLLNYALFTAFFPGILAGPIERGDTLLPQLRDLPDGDGELRRRGLMRFVWGAGKKLIAADTLGLYVDAAYLDPSAVSSGALLAAVLLYSFQIYLDFSAYTDMAVGCSELLGFRLTENFSAPYRSVSVKDFWKKWHMSLTGWFREYLYFPLGGSRMGVGRTALNVLIVFAVSGLWHGASLTFLLWGLLNGAYQVLGSFTLPARRKLWAKLGLREEGRLLTLLRTLLTFAFITGAWILFHSSSPGQAVYVVKRILLVLRDGFGLGSALSLLPVRQLRLLPLCLLVCFWEDRRIALGRSRVPLPENPFAYWGLVGLLCLLIALFGVYGLGFDAREFVYFQF